MYPTSDKLNAVVRYPSHRIATAVHVHAPTGELLKDDLKLQSGFVRVDDGRDIRRRFTARLSDYTGDLTPRDVDDLFHPFARNEFKVYRGVVFEDGTVEQVPQGVFDMSTVKVSDSRDGFTMEVTGYDRARTVQRRRFVTNYVVSIGSNYGTAIKDVITFKRPETVFDFVPTDFVTPQLIFGGSGGTGGGNAWDSAQKMAESIGMDLYFDVHGICVMRPVPSLSDPFVHWHYHQTPDQPNQVLFAEREISDEDTFNHVIATGESTSNDEPVKGEAFDDDPGSPTYIDGPFGDIPTFPPPSPYIRTAAQANEYAAAYLRSKLGIEETVRVISIVHPGHELGDIIHIQSERSGVDANFIVDQFTMPLEATQPLNIGVRTRRANA